MLELVVATVVALAGLVGLFLISQLVADRPPIGFALIGTGVVLDMYFPIWPALVTVAGFSVTFADLSGVVLTLSAMILLSRRPRPYAWFVRLPGMIAVLVLVSVAVGASVHGLSTAVNEARGLLLIIAVCLWILALRPSRPDVRNWIEKWVIWSGVVIVARGILVIATQGLNTASSRVASSDVDIMVTGRPIGATQALLIAFAGFVAISIWRSSGKSRFALLSLVFFMMVVIAQHRSVWAATLAGAAWYIASLDIAKRFVTFIGIFLGGVILVGLVSWIGGGSVLEILTESATDTGTYEGRLYDWVVLAERSVNAGPATVIFGFPFGEGWLRYRADGLVMDYSPHNIFVSSALRIGVVGLVAMIFLSITCLVRAGRCRRQDPTLGALLVLILVYCLAYNFSWLLAPVLGLTIWGADRSSLKPFSESREDAEFNPAKRSRIRHNRVPHGDRARGGPGEFREAR